MFKYIRFLKDHTKLFSSSEGVLLRFGRCDNMAYFDCLRLCEVKRRKCYRFSTLVSLIRTCCDEEHITQPSGGGVLFSVLVVSVEIGKLLS